MNSMMVVFDGKSVWINGCSVPVTKGFSLLKRADEVGSRVLQATPDWENGSLARTYRTYLEYNRPFSLVFCFCVYKRSSNAINPGS